VQAERMMESDAAAKALGIELLEIKTGYARMRMVVRADMVNGFGMCHGGITFSLADTAFAYACNAGNRKTVALACTINFLAPVRVGDELIATAQEKSRGSRTGLYDVTVTDQSEKIVAEFRGTSYSTGESVI
jgi:acyl-CoA thioesterase